MRENSGRAKILEILAKHPDGLNATKIRGLVLKEQALDEHYLISEISRMAREGKFARKTKKECPCCGIHSVMYSLKKPS